MEKQAVRGANRMVWRKFLLNPRSIKCWTQCIRATSIQKKKERKIPALFLDKPIDVGALKRAIDIARYARHQ